MVYGGPSASAATLGEITEDQQWRQVLESLDIPYCQLDSFVGAFLAGARLDAELLAFIGGLRPRYRTGLLSNAWSDIRHWMSTLFPGTLDAFDVSVFSAEVGLTKPDPAVYRLVLKRLGVSEPEAVFVDDLQPNVDAARNLGMHAVWFHSAAQVQHDIQALLADSGS